MVKIVEREKFRLELHNNQGRAYGSTVRYKCTNEKSPIQTVYVAREKLPPAEEGSEHTLTVILDE